MLQNRLWKHYLNAQKPGASRGLRPSEPPPGLCPGPAGDLKLSPDPCQILSPQHQILDPPLQTVSLIHLILAKFLSSKGAYNVTPREKIKSEFSVYMHINLVSPS